jgi:hypothetical protein
MDQSFPSKPRQLRTNLNFENLNYSFEIENTKNQQTTSLYNPKIGENVIFSFLTGTDSVKISLKRNNYIDEYNFHSKTVLLGVNFY